MPLTTKPVTPDLIKAPLQIIEEQRDHIVVAMRVPRKLIEDNHAFLAALSDATISESSGRQMRRWLMYAVAGVVGFAVIVPWKDVARALRKAPLTIISAQAEPSIVHIGEPWTLVFTVVQKRPCTGTTDNFWVSADNEDLLYRVRLPFHGVVSNGQPLTRHITKHLPVGIGPGNYKYNATIHLICGKGDDDDTYIINGPEIPITVIEASKDITP